MECFRNINIKMSIVLVLQIYFVSKPRHKSNLFNRFLFIYFYNFHRKPYNEQRHWCHSAFFFLYTVQQNAEMQLEQG